MCASAWALSWKLIQWALRWWSSAMDQWCTIGSVAAMTVWSSEGLYSLYQLLKLITILSITDSLRLLCPPHLSVTQSLSTCLFIFLTFSPSPSLFLCLFVGFCLTCLPCLSHLLVRAPLLFSLRVFERWQNFMYNTEKKTNMTTEKETLWNDFYKLNALAVVFVTHKSPFINDCHNL